MYTVYEKIEKLAGMDLKNFGLGDVALAWMMDEDC
jgi:hypothetical protein